MKYFTLMLLSVALASNAFAALSGSIVWEVRADGSSANGGGFKTSSGSIDYTQQAAAQWSGTDGTTTASTTFTSATASFNTNVVGHVIRISAGTGATIGYYEIVGYTSATTITLDAVSGTTVNATFKIGGALAAIGNVGSATANQGMVPGNLMCVKAGTYSIGGIDNLACAGTVTSPIRIIGYSTTRPTLTTSGDGYLGRSGVNRNKTLITSNMPTYAYGGGYLTGPARVIIESINFSGSNVSGSVVSISTGSALRNCKIANASTGASATGVSLSLGGLITGCDVSLTGASGGSTGSGIAMGGIGVVNGNRITCGSLSSPAIRAAAFGPNIIVNNVIFSSPNSVGIFVSTINSSLQAIGNTISGCTDGINIIIGNNVAGTQIINNCITDNSGFGINMVSASNSGVLNGNRTRDNASGAINSGTDWVNASNWLSVTTDTGGATSDYLDPANGDFSLIKSSPASFSGVPAGNSIGAFQSVSPTQGGGFF